MGGGRGVVANALSGGGKAGPGMPCLSAPCLAVSWKTACAHLPLCLCSLNPALWWHCSSGTALCAPQLPLSFQCMPEKKHFITSCGDTTLNIASLRTESPQSQSCKKVCIIWDVTVGLAGAGAGAPPVLPGRSGQGAPGGSF
jgi:hypothetical protein